MKPEKGTEDMEDIVWVPAELFAEIGLLVTEARTPDPSPKGRVEGPHCLPVQGIRAHVCDKHRQQCRKSDLQRSHMYMLSTNIIPMRIDVILMPNCDHGQLEASTVVGPITASDEEMSLLERWDIQILPKRPERCDASFVTGRCLLQAVRSYLHFSQLSSWLTSQRGQLPVQIVYRIYAPGESVSHGLVLLPDKHSFPIADLSHSALRVKVSSVPRQKTIPIFLCTDDSIAGNLPHKRKSPQQEGDVCSGEATLFIEHEEKKGKFHSRRHRPDQCLAERSTQSKTAPKLSGPSDQMATGKSREYTQSKPWGSDSWKDTGADWWNKSRQGKQLWPDHPSIPCETVTDAKRPPRSKVAKPTKDVENLSLWTDQPLHNTNMKYKKPWPKSDHSTNTAQSLFKHQQERKLGIASEQNISETISAMKESFRGNPLNLSHSSRDQSHSKTPDPSVLVRRLPSPKVLLTTTGNTKGSPVFFKRRKIDLGMPGDPYDASTEDRVLSDAISDVVKPLKSEDIEAYLSGMSHHVPVSEKTSTTLRNLPLTKCRFYIGDETNDRYYAQENVAPNRNKSDENIEDDSMHRPNAAVRNLFKKSLSEPGPSLFHLEACEITENVDVSSSEKSGIVFPKLSINIEDSDDSTPTNSVTDSQEMMTSCHLSSNMSSTAPSRTLSLTCKQPSSEVEGIKTLNVTKTLTTEGERTPEEIRRSPNHVSRDDSFLQMERDFSGLQMNDSSLSGSKCDWVQLPVSDCDGSVDDEKLSVNSDKTNSKLGKVCDKNNMTKTGKKGGTALCKQILTKELQKNLKNEDSLTQPHRADMFEFRKTLDRSSAMVFNTTTGLPSRSSPAPVKRKSTGRFDYDSMLISARAIKNALSCSKLVLQSECTGVPSDNTCKALSTSAPASTNCLLGNFEESVLNGRIEPVGVVSGFTAEIGAGGSFCPKHITIPVTAYFFQLSDDNAPSPYLGHINLDSLGKRGYHIPSCGTLQVTLFNPNKTVVKMFVVMYDLSDMPPNCQTFLRQRTMYTPVDPNSQEPSYLRYLIHLRISSTKTGKIFLHTDIRLIFARDKFEFDPKVANYELRSYTEGPQNPKFSPKR